MSHSDSPDHDQRPKVLKERLQALLHTDTYHEVEALMKTSYERGVEQGERRSACASWKRSSAPCRPM